MTVEGLIKKLQKLPPDARVMVWNDGLSAELDDEDITISDGEVWFP
jgi:hypothetical protein